MVFHHALHNWRTSTITQAQRRAAPPQAATSLHSSSAFFERVGRPETYVEVRIPHPSLDLPSACDTYRRRASLPPGTCDIQSRSCLMQDAYQELACSRINACNTWTTAPGSLLCRTRRLARHTPDHAIGGMRSWVCIVQCCTTIVINLVPWSVLVLNVGYAVLIDLCPYRLPFPPSP
jgi:hypothetical protein